MPDPPVSSDVQDGVAVLTLNSPPVNALSAPLRTALATELEAAREDDDVTAVVLIGGGRGFCGGADITEFDAPPDPHAPMARDVFDSLESCPKPVVAAIHGYALGGGLELALSCHHRVGVPSARLGQTEVTLGIVPGGGGTQRLPRVVGLEHALRLIVRGERIDGRKAAAIGLLDELVEDEDVLLDAATAFARRVGGAPPVPIRDREVPPVGDAEEVIEAFHGEVARKYRGMLAPPLCIEAVGNAIRLPFQEAMAEERRLFVQTRDSDQSQALRHQFFAERRARHVPEDAPERGSVPPIRSAGVVGFGTMGTGIAMAFANAGVPVVAVDADADNLVGGMQRVRDLYSRSERRGSISAEEMEARAARIQTATTHEALADRDIVVEAVFEDLDVKRTVFEKLDAVCRSDAVLATNTSTLDIDAIAAATDRAETVVGTHFFSPANVMRLIEVVRGRETSRETLAAAMDLARRMGKVGVVVGNADGFVGNRMLYAYSRQANLLLEEGALPDQIDRAMYDFGMPMGPFAMSDLAGLDVGWRIGQRERQAGGRPQRYSPISDQLYERGRLGQKTGAGWYRYGDDGRTPTPDPEVEALVVARSQELGIERRDVDDCEIIERCVAALINTGARTLEEGLVSRPGDIDVIWVNGYGFPAFRGGPMYHADQRGLDHVLGVVRGLRDVDGGRVQPASLLVDLVRDERSFRDLEDGS